MIKPFSKRLKTAEQALNNYCKASHTEEWLSAGELMYRYAIELLEDNINVDLSMSIWDIEYSTQQNYDFYDLIVKFDHLQITLKNYIHDKSLNN